MCKQTIKQKISTNKLSAYSLNKYYCLFMWKQNIVKIVEKFSERVVAFYNGEIIADDEPSKVFNQNNVKKFIIGGS